MEIENLFDFPLVATLAVIHCSTGLRNFTLVDDDWNDMIPLEVKMRVKLRLRICSTENIRIYSNSFIPNFCMEIFDSIVHRDAIFA